MALFFNIEIKIKSSPEKFILPVKIILKSSLNSGKKGMSIDEPVVITTQKMRQREIKVIS